MTAPGARRAPPRRRGTVHESSPARRTARAPAERVRADLTALVQALQAAQLIEADQPA